MRADETGNSVRGLPRLFAAAFIDTVPTTQIAAKDMREERTTMPAMTKNQDGFSAAVVAFPAWP